MKSLMRFLVFSMALALQVNVHAQRDNLDSLWTVWSDETAPDSSRLDAINEFIMAGYFNNKPDSAFYFAQLHYEFAKKRGNRKAMANALNTQAGTWWTRGEFYKAIDALEVSLTLNEQVGDSAGMSRTMNNIGVIYYNLAEYNEAERYWKESLELKKRLGTKDLSSNYNNLGNVAKKQGDFEQALVYYKQSLLLSKEMEDDAGVAICLSNLGNVYRAQGNHAKAIGYYNRSLTLSERTENLKGVTSNLNHIGSVYSDQEDYSKALASFERGLELSKQSDQKQMVASFLNNIGNVYSKQKKYDQALKAWEESLQIQRDISYKTGVIQTLNSLGNHWLKHKSYEKALAYFDEAITLALEAEDQEQLTSCLNNLGAVYYEQGEYDKAMDHHTRAKTLADRIGMIKEIQNASWYLYLNYKLHSHTDSALAMHESYVKAKDSLNSLENGMAIIRQQFDYQYQNQIVADSVRNAEEQKVKEAELAREKAERILERKDKQRAIIVGLGIAVLLSGFVAFLLVSNKRRQRVNRSLQEKNDLIESQKAEVELKNAEITDSINYAKRIQNALLASNGEWEKISQEQFVLFRPKDVVSGDFHWAYHSEEKNVSIWCVADCTGHGVPGALMSMLGIGFLNEIVIESGVTKADKILELLREKITKALNQKNADIEQKDGMDMALCVFHHGERKLEFCGANNPMYLISSNSPETQLPEDAVRTTELERTKGKLYEIKPNRIPVGKYAQTNIPFGSVTLELAPGDTLILSSDGFADQFGGANGKKYKYGNFKRKLLDISSTPLSEQKELLEKEFDNWKGTGEQVDDVCVIGVRV